MSAVSKPHSELAAKVLKEHEYRTHGGRTNFIQVCATCNAIRNLEEQLDTTRAALERMVYEWELSHEITDDAYDQATGALDDCNPTSRQDA